MKIKIGDLVIINLPRDENHLAKARVEELFTVYQGKNCFRIKFNGSNQQRIISEVFLRKISPNGKIYSTNP